MRMRGERRKDGEMLQAIRAGARGHCRLRAVLAPLVGAYVAGLLAASRPPAASAQEPGARRRAYELVYLDEPDGRRFLDESETRGGFVTLSMHFVTQDNLAYCGVATTAMVLNATGIERPTSPEHAPFKLFTQSNLFNERVRQVAPPESVKRAGMDLKTLGKVLESFPVDVKVCYASGKSLGRFRDDAVECLKGTESFVVVNYLRRAMGQNVGGHISPLAAYHRGEDRFLILDVARYKYPPVWVKADDLWRAMEAVDAESGKSRGYVIVTKPSARAAVE
jgi:hypothetical protein